MTLFKLGEAYKAASNLDAALKSFEESVSILRGPSDITDRERPSARSDRILSIARGLNEIGNIYLALGDAAAMMEALNEASRLLIQSDRTISQISFECGFETLSYFNRVFLNKKGITPSFYRKSSASS